MFTYFFKTNKQSIFSVTTAAANLSGYRVIKGSKIINVERVIQHPHHQQQEGKKKFLFFNYQSVCVSV